MADNTENIQPCGQAPTEEPDEIVYSERMLRAYPELHYFQLHPTITNGLEAELIEQEKAEEKALQAMMEATDGPSGLTNQQQAPLNPPSVEAAYKRKCIELKKRLSEVEAHNEELRIRNQQGARYIQKMRLESAMLLDRLAQLTGGAEGKAADNNNNGADNIDNNNNEVMEQSFNHVGERGGPSYGHGYLDEPQERPLRPKRGRKDDDEAAPNDHGGHGPGDGNLEIVSSTLPPILPAIGPHHPPAAGYDPSGHPPTHVSPYTPIGSASTRAAIAPRAGSGGPLGSSPLRPHHPGLAPASSPFTPIAPSSSSGGAHGQPLHHHSHLPPPPSHNPRYVSAFEEFANRNKDQVIKALVERDGPNATISEAEVDHILEREWEEEQNRHYGARKNGL